MVGEVEEDSEEAVSEMMTVGGEVKSRVRGLLMLGYSSCEAKSSFWASIESRMMSCSRDAAKVETSAACCREKGRPWSVAGAG